MIDGLVTAGITQDADQLAFLNGLFGTEFGTLADMKAFNLQLVSDGWDKNQNGYVCAYELRGTRAHFEDPLINTTSFGISDDKIRRK